MATGVAICRVNAAAITAGADSAGVTMIAVVTTIAASAGAIAMMTVAATVRAKAAVAMTTTIADRAAGVAAGATTGVAMACITAMAEVVTAWIADMASTRAADTAGVTIPIVAMAVDTDGMTAAVDRAALAGRSIRPGSTAPRRKSA